MTAMTNFLENKLIDFTLRGQALGIGGASAAAGTGPATVWIGLLTTPMTEAGTFTEVTGGDYARVAVQSSLANWAGTQGAGTTAVSSGTSGATSNNVAITFPAPTADWGRASDWAAFDAATGGNALLTSALQVPKNINFGDPAPKFDPGALTWQIDN